MQLPAKSPAFLGIAVMVGRKHIKGLVKATLLYILYAGESTEAIATETSLSRRQIQRYCEKFQNTGDPYITLRS